MPIFKALVWLDPEKSRCKQDSNPAPYAPEATMPARRWVASRVPVFKSLVWGTQKKKKSLVWLEIQVRPQPQRAPPSTCKGGYLLLCRWPPLHKLGGAAVVGAIYAFPATLTIVQNSYWSQKLLTDNNSIEILSSLCFSRYIISGNTSIHSLSNDTGWQHRDCLSMDTYSVKTLELAFPNWYSGETLELSLNW